MFREQDRNAIYTQRNLFELLFNQTVIRLYLPLSDWFRTKRTSVWFQINRNMVYKIWFRCDLISFRKDFSVCTNWWGVFGPHAREAVRNLAKSNQISIQIILIRSITIWFSSTRFSNVFVFIEHGLSWVPMLLHAHFINKCICRWKDFHFTLAWKDRTD